MMINAIRQKMLVREGGKIELSSPELPDGAMVEVIVFLPPEDEQDQTDYLLSTEANCKHLLDAMARAEHRENLITLTPEEWHEKYRI
jgi:antitoxin YefM